MNKREFGQERFENFMGMVERNYDPKYAPQIRAEWEKRAPEDEFQPAIVLRQVQEADPDYRRNVRAIIDLASKKLCVA